MSEEASLQLQLLRLKRSRTVQTSQEESSAADPVIEEKLIQRALRDAIHASDFLPSHKKLTLLQSLENLPLRYAQELAAALQREQIRFSQGLRNLYGVAG